MPRNKPDDPFTDDDWGPQEGTAASDEMPEASVDPERTPFLKPWHMKERRGRLELVSVSGSTEYSDAVFHVKYGGKSYRIGLKNFDPGYIACRKKFGNKRADWHGMLEFKIMPHRGNPDGYVAIRPA